MWVHVGACGCMARHKRQGAFNNVGVPNELSHWTPTRQLRSRYRPKLPTVPAAMGSTREGRCVLVVGATSSTRSTVPRKS